MIFNDGAPARIRTADLLITNYKIQKFFLYLLDLTTLLAVCESTKYTRTTKGLHTDIVCSYLSMFIALTVLEKIIGT